MMLNEERHVVEPVTSPEVVPPTHAEDHVKEKSVYKGVFRCGKKFKAQIQTNRVQHYLGLFDTEVEAARAYDNHARVVLGPKARTNFEYSNQVSSEQPVVLVAPLFTRQDGRSNFTEGAGEQAAPTAPKRSYVGIKMKRKESARMGRLGEELDPHALPHSPFFGHPLAGPFGSNPMGLSGPDSRMSAFNPKSIGGTMTEEQYRWYEQFQQMQQIQQHQQFLMQFGASLPNPYSSFGANFMQGMSGIPGMPGSDLYSTPYMSHGTSAGAASQYGMFPYDAIMAQQQGNSQFPSFGPFPSQTQAQTQAQTPDLSPLVNMYANRDVTPSSPRKPTPYGLPAHAVPKAGAGQVGTSASSVARGSRVRDMPRDQSTLAAAVQLGQLMGLSTQSMLSDVSNGSANTGPAPSAASTAATSSRVASSATSSVVSAGSEYAEGVVERAAVSPASSHSGSRHSSGTIDEDAQVLLDASRSSAYQFTGQPLPNSLPADPAQPRVNAIAPLESTPQEEANEEEDLDWRDQLYYWTGILYFDPVRAVQVWKGSWVGSYSGKPMPEEFSWSFNHFEYTLDGGRNTPTQSPEGILLPQSGPMQGYYLMDNDGSGALQRYEDTEYLVEFDALPNLVGGGISELYVVYGRGDSDFGEFVVTGSYNKRTRILEMTRQYIAENDARSRMPIAQLKTVMRHQR